MCVAVCCSVLQCVAVCCSVLQCVAVCCSVLQCVAVYITCISHPPCTMYNTSTMSHSLLPDSVYIYTLMMYIASTMSDSLLTDSVYIHFNDANHIHDISLSLIPLSPLWCLLHTQYPTLFYQTLYIFPFMTHTISDSLLPDSLFNITAIPHTLESNSLHAQFYHVHHIHNIWLSLLWRSIYARLLSHMACTMSYARVTHCGCDIASTMCDSLFSDQNIESVYLMIHTTHVHTHIFSDQNIQSVYLMIHTTYTMSYSLLSDSLFSDQNIQRVYLMIHTTHVHTHVYHVRDISERQIWYMLFTYGACHSEKRESEKRASEKRASDMVHVIQIWCMSFMKERVRYERVRCYWHMVHVIHDMRHETWHERIWWHALLTYGACHSPHRGEWHCEWHRGMLFRYGACHSPPCLMSCTTMWCMSFTYGACHALFTFTYGEWHASFTYGDMCYSDMVHVIHHHVLLSRIWLALSWRLLPTQYLTLFYRALHIYTFIRSMTCAISDSLFSDSLFSESVYTHFYDVYVTSTISDSF